jgi:hypothetical protein
VSAKANGNTLLTYAVRTPPRLLEGWLKLTPTDIEK